MLTICTRVAGLHLEITPDGIHMEHQFRDLIRVVWLDVVNFLFIIVRFDPTNVKSDASISMKMNHFISTASKEVEWCKKITNKLMNNRYGLDPSSLANDVNVVDIANGFQHFTSRSFEMRDFFAWSEFNFAVNDDRSLDKQSCTMSSEMERKKLLSTTTIIDVFSGVVDLYNDVQQENIDTTNEMFLRECGNTLIKIRNLVCSNDATIHVSGNTYVEVFHCTFQRNLSLHLSDYAKILGVGSMVEQRLNVNADTQSLCAGFLTLGRQCSFTANHNAKISVYIQCPENGRYRFERLSNMAQICAIYTENSLLMKWKRTIQSHLEIWRFLNRKLEKTLSRTPIGRNLFEETNFFSTNHHNAGVGRYDHEQHQQYVVHHNTNTTFNEEMEYSEDEDEERDNDDDDDTENENEDSFPIQSQKSTARTQLNITQDMRGFSCIICCQSLVEMVVKPCGHACLCRTCAHKYMRMKQKQFNVTGNPPNCPICREKISKMRFVYFS